ncbi:MAG: hypothetical protein HGA85_01140 [Nanoarchaeota archaeon]|nr:hypothetical protein [Nanoarchaeota archaeon]
MTELAHITKNGELVSKEDWTRYLASIKAGVAIDDVKTAIAALHSPFSGAIQRRVKKERFAILFSGGVDSTLIAIGCKSLGLDFECVTVGLEGSKDMEVSSRIAEEYGLKHVKKTLSDKDAEAYFEKAAQVLGPELTNIVNIGVGAVVLAALELSTAKFFFSGLGSEEIFAGYSRHTHAEDINAECWKGLASMYDRDLKRDCKIADHMQVSFLVPFMDTELIKVAMGIDGKLKIKDGTKKYALRELAVSLGLKEEYAFRPKSAAQYGSKIDKALEHARAKHGFKEKGDYVRSLRKAR